MHAQIVADTLGIPYDRVEVSEADTARVPNSGPTVASRTCMVVGKILQECAREMKRRLGRMSPREYLAKHGPLLITKEYRKPAEMQWSDETYRGDAYGAYGWGCDVVEVERDSVPSPFGPSASPRSRRSAGRSIRSWPPARSRGAPPRGSATPCWKRSSCGTGAWPTRS